jgi:L-threonylcarbamoyladenylate synthase
MGYSLPSPIRQRVREGIRILKRGGLVAFPTDTVYGLGAAITIQSAVARVYQVKQRPPNMALPLLLSDISQIDEVAGPLTPMARRLITAFLPGALTLVLCKTKTVPDFVTAGQSTVAIRVPAHPVPVALARGLGAPIVGTSANMSGQPSPLTAEEVRAQLGDKIDLVIDGGPSWGNKESTIVDVTGETPVVLREGAISREELKRVLGSDFPCV